MGERRLLCKAFIFEAIAISLCEYIVAEGFLIVCLSSLKSFLLLVHQNFLLICELMLAKLPQDSNKEGSAAWRLSLLLSTRYRSKVLKENKWELMEKNNGEIIHQFQNISLSIRLSCRLQSGKQSLLLNTINGILSDIDKHTAYKAKELLFRSLTESVAFFSHTSLKP